MLASKYRFRGYGSLRYVYKRGKTVRSPQIALRFTRNERRQLSRCAVVVSKSVSKSAVTRNRIRRRLYEQTRLLLPRANNAYDLILTVFQPEIASIQASELSAIVEDLFGRAGILSDDAKKSHDMIDTKER
jgi:ribonuclease P protein component